LLNFLDSLSGIALAWWCDDREKADAAGQTSKAVKKRRGKEERT